MNNQTPKPHNIVPGQGDSTLPYKHQEFPKAVYRGTLDDCVIIKSEDERPEGYVDYDDIVNPPTEPTQAEIDAAKKAEADAATKAAEDEAATKAEEAKAAEKALRESIYAYLDEHDVNYDKRVSTPKLEELKVALDDHLKQQSENETKDDAE